MAVEYKLALVSHYYADFSILNFSHDVPYYSKHANCMHEKVINRGRVHACSKIYLQGQNSLTQTDYELN